MGEFMRTNDVDTLIVWRYIHCLISIPFIHRARQIFVWVHDVIIHSAYNGKYLENNAGGLIQNFSSRIDRVMCQSKWHADVLKGLYPSLKDKIVEMPNGVDTSLIENMAKTPSPMPKKLHRFLWASHHDRNIENLLRMWPLILEKIPDATLVVCGDSTERTKSVLAAAVNQLPSPSTRPTIYSGVNSIPICIEWTLLRQK
jgi:glycosyltransferase involved in cell wall biosynthesis